MRRCLATTHQSGIRRRSSQINGCSQISGCFVNRSTLFLNINTPKRLFSATDIANQFCVKWKPREIIDKIVYTSLGTVLGVGIFTGTVTIGVFGWAGMKKGYEITSSRVSKSISKRMSTCASENKVQRSSAVLFEDLDGGAMDILVNYKNNALSYNPVDGPGDNDHDDKPWFGMTLCALYFLVGMSLINNQVFEQPCTIFPRLYTTEIWEYVNAANLLHPMHGHLIQAQLLNRQVFDNVSWFADWSALNANNPPGEGQIPLPVGPYLVGLPILPLANEIGWKDTFQCPLDQVTRVIYRWAPQQDNAKFPFDATAAPGYLNHCHILMHEDNSMMVPVKLTL